VRFEILHRLGKDQETASFARFLAEAGLERIMTKGLNSGMPSPRAPAGGRPARGSGAETHLEPGWALNGFEVQRNDVSPS
jgi:hypothetical protein